MEKSYSVKQVAEILGYSTNSIYTFLKEGQIVGIRLGKGRYRVAQTELNKILHLKKSPEAPSVSMIMAKTTPIYTEKIPSILQNSIPCLFDWFISLVSIIMGLTMILFNRNFEEFSTVPLSEFLFSIQINFLIAGIGLFIVNILNLSRKKAFFIFYLIIFANSLVFSVFLFLGKDILGSFFFILSSIIIIFHTVFNQKGTVSFSLLVAIITVLSPIIMLLFPSVIDLNEIINATGKEQNLIILFWSVLVIFVNLFIWQFKKEKKSIYWISFIIISIGLGYFAYMYSAQLYWSRTLVYILLILFLFILSFWDVINEGNRKGQIVTTRIFINVALIFIVGIGSIWVIQNNIHGYAQNELVNKLIYGRNMIESTISESQNKLEILSRNKTLIEAIKKEDINILDGLIKDVFVYSSTFRKVLVANKEGDLLTNYPYETIGYQNIAFRDYFIKVKTEKKSYLSDIFQSSANGQKRYVVSINVPILDAENNFLGILIGSFDLNYINNKLQQIANLNEQEYFFMIDKIGDLIITPTFVNKLSTVEIEELTRNVPKGINIEETLGQENKQLQIHDKVDDQEWTIAIRRPLVHTYNFDKLTNFLIVFSLLGFSLSIIYLNIFYLNR